METVKLLLLLTSFVFASCRAENVNLADHGMAFPLASRRLAVLSPESTANSIIYPKEHEALWRTLSSGVHLVGVSVIAYCLARRTDRLSAKGLISLPLSRWLVTIIFIDSWCFVFASGLLITGVGLSLNAHACSAGIFLCILLYALSKILIYWFLVEKVHLVHPHPSHTRFGSPAYRICITFVIGYVVVIVLAITGRISYIRNGNPPLRTSHIANGTDGACVIGLGRYASTTLLIYDFSLNVFFTCMFLYPIYKTSNLSPRLRSLAKRNFIAATVSLLTSAINIFVLTILHGQELGWICLASCGSDVVVNAVAIFFVTAVTDEGPESCTSSTGTTTEKSPRAGKVLAGIRKVLPNSRPHLPIIANANLGTSTSTRGILEVEDRERWTSEMRSTTTRTVHFSPDGTLVTRHDRTTLGIVTEKEVDLEAGETATPLHTQDPRPRPPSFQPATYARGEHSGRRSRPSSLTISRLGQPATYGVHLEPSSYASSGLPLASDYPRPGTPEDTTLEVRKEVTKRTWDPTLPLRSSSKSDKSSNPDPNPNSDSNSNSNHRSRSGSSSSSETATPSSPPPLSNITNSRRKRLSLTTSESHDTILLNSSNFSFTPTPTPTSARFPSIISNRSSTPNHSIRSSTPNINVINSNGNSNSGRNDSVAHQPSPSPSPNQSSSTLGTRLRPPATTPIPAPEEIRGRLSVLAAVTEATSTGKSSKMGGNRKRSNTELEAPTLEVSVVTETTQKVEQRRSRARSRDNSLLLDDYHGSTYNRGRSHSSTGGL